MTEAPRYYPMGLADFAEIRSQGMLYVDKTRWIQGMLRPGAKYYFLARPRRFGKSLLVSTMQAYFEGRRELFDGLALGEAEGDWTCHPVIRLDLSTAKSADVEGLRQELSAILGRQEQALGITPVNATLSSRLVSIVHAAVEQTGQRAVILVDEYDAPLLNVIDDPKRLPAFREVMRELYAPLKSLDPNLRFVFLTGITKFSQLSVFSELNNLNDISMDPEYAGLCGITEGELHGCMQPDVAWLAGTLGMGTDELYNELKRRYDGYHFSWPSPDVYNPFSLVTTLQKGRLGSWWYASGTPSALPRLLRSGSRGPLDLERGVKARASLFDAPAERGSEPTAFMYQAGYLTIKAYDHRSDAYTLGIPNQEVENGLFETLLPSYVGGTADSRDSYAVRFADAVWDDDMDSALRELRSFLASIPYDMAPKSEKDFQTVLWLALGFAGIGLDSEVRTATGRVDLVARTDECVCVIELKYDRSAEEAVRQIDERGYLIPWEAGDRRVVKVGANFSPAERTLEEGWIIREG